MRNKKWILNLIIVLLICTFSISGCKFFYSTRLKTPILSINETDKTLMWDTNYNASAYEVQMNEKVVATITSTTDQTQYVYNYANVVGEFGEFRFRVKCIGSGKYADSELSNVITIKLGTANNYLNKNITSTRYAYDDRYDVTNVGVKNNVLTWTAPSGASNLSGYLVSIYTNTLGIKHYETSTTSLSITDAMMSANDILAINVCSVVGGVNYETKELYYFNPIDKDEHGVYTDTIYIFDGEVYDYYIENWAELQNLYYYSFIYRLENVKFKVSNDFYRAYDDTYFDTITGKANTYINGIGSNTAYHETTAFITPPYLTLNNISSLEFSLRCKFQDFDSKVPGLNTDPYIESTAFYTQDQKFTPYYETVSYDKRTDNYNDFSSDNWFLETEVTTSEELFWAVSSHITPVFSDNDINGNDNSTKSRAYLIYEEAKNILRDIISDDMSEYEKALSIFDYIMLNTTYDKNATEEMDDASIQNHNPMKYMCYYLESVFISSSKLAVCDGYAKAYALLCNMEGINCVRITGVAGNGGHAWNKVEINGNWYVVDITWTEIADDTNGFNDYKSRVTADGLNYLSEFNPDEEECSHTYFLVSDGFIEATHTDYRGRYLYSILDAPVSFNYYVNDNITYNGKSLSRIVTKVSDLSEILKLCAEANYTGGEIVIDYELFAIYGGSTSDILKAAKPYNFVSMEQTLFYASTTPKVLPEPLEYNGTIYYLISEVAINYIYYDATNLDKVGILMILKPAVTLSTNDRVSDFIEFVKDTKIDHVNSVSLTTEKIEQWIGTSITNDSARIEAIEAYFNDVFNGDIIVNITRKTEDVTEQVYTQEEDGSWVTKNMTSADYLFEFSYND